MFLVQLHYADPATTLGTAQMALSFQSADRSTVADLVRRPDVIDFVGEAGQLQFQRYRAADAGVLPADVRLSQLVQSFGRLGSQRLVLDLSVSVARRVRQHRSSASDGSQSFCVRLHYADLATSCGTAQIELHFGSSDVVTVADLAKDPDVVDFIGFPGRIQFRRYRAVEHRMLPGNAPLVQLQQASGGGLAILELSVSVAAIGGSQ